MTGRRRVLRGVRVALFLLVAATLLDAGHPARAQDAAPLPSLGGLQGRAASSGLHVNYNPQGLLPIPNLVDIGAPDALATVASGPTTFARASVLDPGDILANPDAVLALAGGSAYPGGLIPPYPYRITANSGTGDPPVDSSPAPGLTARVSAEGGTSEARAAVGEADAPTILHLASAISEAETETDGSTVTVHARSRMSDLNLLGLLRIDAVVTDLTATSDGTETELSGGTTVVGASLLGQPVTIDAEGVHLAEGGGGNLLGGILRPLVGSLNDVLTRAGLRVTVASPVELGSGGAAGQLTAAGLRIDVTISRDTLPLLAALIDAFPPIDNPIPGAPGLEDLLVAARATHPVAISVARGEVSLSARPAFVPDAVDVPSRGGAPSPAVPSAGSTGGLALPPSAPPAAPTSTPVAPTRTDAEIPTGAGIGGLVLLALLSQPFIGDRIAAGAQAILGAGAGAACPWEEP